MCGRYASSRRPEDLVEEFDVARAEIAAPLAADYNVAPTHDVYAVLERPANERRSAPERQLRVLQWGLVPSWATDPGIGSKMINARAETVAEKPAYRRPFAARRCLLPADGYYEWYPTQARNARGKPVKQPFFIRPPDGGVLAMAGLYEIWRDPEKGEEDPERFRWTCTVLTTEATDDLGRLHDRMPLLVDPAARSAWLDTTQAGSQELLATLRPAAPGHLEAFPVSTLVGDVRNNGPELVEPVAAEV